MTELLYSCLPR